MYDRYVDYLCVVVHVFIGFGENIFKPVFCFPFTNY